MTVKIPTTVNESLQFLRSAMPIAKRFAYFDHAAVSPLPEVSAKKIAGWANQNCLEGDTRWPDWARDIEKTRTQAAKLIESSTTEIALIPNTTFGINVIASGVPWKAGDNLVVPGNEFSSNLLPWKLLAERGVDVRIAEIPPISSRSSVSLIDLLAPLIDQSTKIVSVSWVGFCSGYRCDLSKLCDVVHSAGAKLFVDAIQGLGAFPLSVKSIPIDFLAADGHKWMLGPEGAGLLYVRNKHMDWLKPAMMGWNSVVSAHNFDPSACELKPNAHRYEGGAANMPGHLALGESIQLLSDCNLENWKFPLTESIHYHCDYLVEELSRIGAQTFRPIDPSTHSGIVPFLVPDRDSAAVRAHLLQRDIVLSVRNGFLRAAVHGYNSVEDIDRLIVAIKEFQ